MVASGVSERDLLDGEGREHRRRRRAGRADQPLGAAGEGGDEAEGGSAEDAGQSAIGRKGTAE